MADEAEKQTVFEVHIPEVWYSIHTVKLPATSTRDEIIDAVMKIYGRENPDLFEYSHTEDEEDWEVYNENYDLIC